MRDRELRTKLLKLAYQKDLENKDFIVEYSYLREKWNVTPIQIDDNIEILQSKEYITSFRSNKVFALQITLQGKQRIEKLLPKEKDD